MNDGEGKYTIDQVMSTLLELSKTVDALSKTVDARFDKVDARFDKVDARFNYQDQVLTTIAQNTIAPEQQTALGLPKPPPQGYPFPLSAVAKPK